MTLRAAQIAFPASGEAPGLFNLVSHIVRVTVSGPPADESDYTILGEYVIIDPARDGFRWDQVVGLETKAVLRVSTDPSTYLTYKAFESFTEVIKGETVEDGWRSVGIQYARVDGVVLPDGKAWSFFDSLPTDRTLPIVPNRTAWLDSFSMRDDGSLIGNYTITDEHDAVIDPRGIEISHDLLLEIPF